MRRSALRSIIIAPLLVTLFLSGCTPDTGGEAPASAQLTATPSASPTRGAAGSTGDKILGALNPTDAPGTDDTLSTDAADPGEANTDEASGSADGDAADPDAANPSGGGLLGGGSTGGSRSIKISLFVYGMSPGDTLELWPRDGNCVRDEWNGNLDVSKNAFVDRMMTTYSASAACAFESSWSTWNMRLMRADSQQYFGILEIEQTSAPAALQYTARASCQNNNNLKCESKQQIIVIPSDKKQEGLLLITLKPE
ncbi:hypothetical protein ACL9RL_17795 [Plantibacter sp. Mn2098]|uniref:hypothetical protein n=1 Tax=Plantibacter sp. Mn2098 TaxID=3395266 RepID=UPI003BC6B638